MTGQHNANSWQEQSPSVKEFYESARRVSAKDKTQPFDLESERILEGFPYELKLELNKALRVVASAPGEANPASFTVNSRIMTLTSLVAALRACLARGIMVHSIRDLATDDAVTAIEAKLGSCWAPSTVSICLAYVYRICIVLYHSCNPYVAERRDFHARGRKRDLSNRIFTPEEYRRGALAIASVANLIGLDKRHRAGRLHRGACLLILASFIHARRSEYIRMNVEHLTPRRLLTGETCLSVKIDMKKTGNGRIVIIRDLETIELLTSLLDAPEGTPLFRKNDGSRYDWRAFAELFETFGRLAVGQPASANIFRSSSTLGRMTRQERANRVGHREWSPVAEESYMPNLTIPGTISLQKNNAMTRAALYLRRGRASGA